MSRVGRSSRHIVWCGIAVALIAASACGGSGTTSPTTTTAPATAPTTEVFTGTVPVGGSDFKTFTVALSNGLINITLTAAGPPSTISMGLGVGQPGAGTCALFTGGSTPTPAGTIAQLSGTAQAGNYCVSVFDIGNQLADVQYSVTVTHY